MTEVAASAAPTPAMRDRVAAAAVFVLALLAYSANGDVLPGNDATPNILLPVEVLERGRLTVSPRDYPELFGWQLATSAERIRIRRWEDVIVDGRPGLEAYDAGVLRASQSNYYLAPAVQPDEHGRPRYAGIYGIGAGLTALPVFAAAKALGTDLRRAESRWRLGKLAASLCTAGAVVFVFLLARLHLGLGAALWITAATALGTCLWSGSSQTLWQHGPSELFLLAGTWCLVARPGALGFAAAAGAAFGWAVLCRPTGAAAVIAAGCYLLAVDRRAALAFCAGGAPFAMLLAWYNDAMFGSPLAFGQLAAGLDTGGADGGVWSTPFWTGLAGQLVSPSSGLLVFSPFLGATFVGMWLSWRTPAYRPFRVVALVALALLLVDVKWFTWWGAWSYGYRIKADAAAVLAVLLIPALPAIQARGAARLAFLLAVAWAVGVQWLGAFAFDVDGWHNRVVGYWANVPGIEQPVALTPAQAREREAGGTAKILAPIHGDTGDPAFRHRLWSLSDNPIHYYATHYSESRARKRRHMREHWSHDPAP
jgi:hypothetical protein